MKRHAAKPMNDSHREGSLKNAWLTAIRRRFLSEVYDYQYFFQFFNLTCLSLITTLQASEDSSI